MDRQKWVLWLFEAKTRYGLIILNYAVTTNNIHLLVLDEKGRDVIPESIKLVAGRIAWEYNLRKNRKGAFWEDRYCATDIESERHLLRCLVYGVLSDKTYLRVKIFLAIFSDHLTTVFF